MFQAWRLFDPLSGVGSSQRSYVLRFLSQPRGRLPTGRNPFLRHLAMSTSIFKGSLENACVPT